MTTTMVQIGRGSEPPAGRPPEAGTLTLVALASGGVKVGTFRGCGRLAGWDGEPRLVFAGAGGGFWLLIDERYARRLAPLGPAAATRGAAGSPPAPVPGAAAGDRVLIRLRNHLTYSGYFFGRVKNPFHSDRGGSLLGFERGAPLLYWFDDGAVGELRITVPGSLADTRPPLGFFRV